VTWSRNAWLASSGAWVGFLAWATSTQLNYSLVPWECDTGARIVPWIALALIMLSLGGGALSLETYRRRGQRLETATPEAGTPFEMLAAVGVAAAVLFALVIALQGIAAFIVPRCTP
jgi:hypothetical protein